MKGIQIVGEASTSEDLVGLVQSLIEVVIVDFLAEGFDIDVVGGHETPMRVLAITSEQSGHTIVNALKAE